MKACSHLGRWATLLALCLLCGFNLRGGVEAEDELKSATVLAFVQNAHWTGRLAADTPLTVGVMGRSAFIRQLHSSVEGKSVNGHQLRIVELNGAVDPNCCQVLYFATEKSAEIKPVLRSFNSAHVLTIGESDGFLDDGGAVNLFLTDGHMAFEVSLNALGKAGVEISSRLLRFGQIRGRTRGGPLQ